MGDAIISVEELSKAFGQHEVLRKIDFNVEPGEIICIVGSSGSGKSTLLRCATMLETMDQQAGNPDQRKDPLSWKRDRSSPEGDQ